MSLDVYLTAVRPVCVFESNITHNLGAMAKAAGLYDYLWQPEKHNITHAKQLIAPLQIGLDLLLSDPARFKSLSPANGWGTYKQLVEFVCEYLAACIENPDAEISISR